MRTRSLLVLVAFFVALPVLAQSNDVGVWFAHARLDSTTTPDARVRFSSGHGYAVSFNHYWSHAIATEIAYAKTRHNGHLDAGDQTLFGLGRYDLKTLTATVQWHFASQSFIDPYLGAGAGRISNANLTSADLAAAGVDRVKIESKTGFLGNAGLNFNVSPHFGAGLDLKYLRVKPSSSSEGTEPLKLDLNPLTIAAGVRFRF